MPNASSSPFPDCEGLSDTLLAKIAAGNECLAAIASFHNIPYPRFTLWLLQPATQERLAALSTAIASAARLTATAALPDIVRGLKTTVDQLQSQNHMTIAPPGANHLVAESIILRRHRALIAAASLIYRISRFTCPGTHPPRPQRDKVVPRTLSPQGSAQRGEVASAQHEPVRGAFGSSAASQRRNLARLPSLPSLDLPAIDFADPDPRPARESAAASELLPREGEVSPKATEGARSPARGADGGAVEPGFGGETEGAIAVLTDSPPLSSPPSDINVDDALRMLTAAYDLTAEEVAELRNDSHSWIRDFIPPPAAETSATRSARPTADDG